MGDLSGKTIIGVVVWLVAWLVLGLVWKDREVGFRPLIITSAILLVVGLVCTFPPFFDLFAAS